MLISFTVTVSHDAAHIKSSTEFMEVRNFSNGYYIIILKYTPCLISSYITDYQSFYKINNLSITKY